jgi:hypothetical protein
MLLVEYLYPLFIILHVILLGLSFVYFDNTKNFFWILVFGVLLFLIESILIYTIFAFFDIQIKLILILVTFVLILLHAKNQVILKQYLKSNKVEVVSHLAVLILSSSIAWLFTFLPVTKPDVLRDGPYVWKTWSLPVQMQRLALDYPPDNALPAVVGEYLLKRISFEKVAPILPGQAVGNRTFLMSFPYVASRISFTDVERKVAPVNQFQYVGTSWPDTLSLVTDQNFRIYLGTTIPLNLLILNLVIWYYFRYVLSKKFEPKIIFLVAAISLTPIAIFNSIFSWPKNFASFFIAIASYFLVKNRSIMASFFWCLAYLVHPLALPFLALPIFLVLLNRKYYTLRKIGFFYIGPIVTLFTWFYWVKFGVNSEFDLIGQNTKTNQSIAGQLWIRIYNINNLTFGNFLDFVPFSSTGFLLSYFASLISLFGIAVFSLIYFFKESINFIMSKTEYVTNLIFGLLITMLFSYPIASINHGWQAFWPALIAAFYIIISQKSKLTQYIGFLSMIFSHLLVYLLWINEVI